MSDGSERVSKAILVLHLPTAVRRTDHWFFDSCTKGGKGRENGWLSRENSRKNRRHHTNRPTGGSGCDEDRIGKRRSIVRNILLESKCTMQAMRPVLTAVEKAVQFYKARKLPR